MSCGMMSSQGVTHLSGLGVPMPKGSWGWVQLLASTCYTLFLSSQLLLACIARMVLATVPILV